MTFSGAQKAIYVSDVDKFGPNAVVRVTKMDKFEVNVDTFGLNFDTFESN